MSGAPPPPPPRLAIAITILVRVRVLYIILGTRNYMYVHTHIHTRIYVCTPASKRVHDCLCSAFMTALRRAGLQCFNYAYVRARTRTANYG